MSLFKAILEKMACKHQWKEFERVYGHEHGNPKPCQIVSTMICHGCGKIKKVSL